MKLIGRYGFLVCTVVAFFCSLVVGFLPRLSTRATSSMTILSARRSSSSSSTGGGDTNSSPWKQKPDESEFAYLKRLQQMASSTQEFAIRNTTETAAAQSAPQKAGGYVRVEEWNEQQKQKQKCANLTWEERVQFEGQRQGDRFRQNEILRKNLKYFG